MDDNDWQPEVLIERLRAEYDPDGSLNNDREIEVTANYSEALELRFLPDEKDYKEAEEEDLAESYDPGDLIDTEYRNGAYARLRFEVDDDGVARLSEFKDAEPSNANWVGVGFLRTAHAAEDVVRNVPGVEQVVNTEDVLLEELAKSDDARIERY